MDRALLLVGAVILICILMNRWVEKLAVPSFLCSWHWACVLVKMVCCTFSLMTMWQ